MKFNIGDKVKVVSGSDFGRTGTVFRVFDDETKSVAVTYNESRTDIGVYPQDYLQLITEDTN